MLRPLRRHTAPSLLALTHGARATAAGPGYGGWGPGYGGWGRVHVNNAAVAPLPYWNGAPQASRTRR